MIDKIHTVVTAAGRQNALFREAGFTVPKNLIKISSGDLLIIESIKRKVLNTDYLSIAISREDERLFNLSNLIKATYPLASVYVVPDEAKGALISALFACGDIRSDSPICITTGDSLELDDPKVHFSHFISTNASAGTICFPSDDPRWSYLKLSNSNEIEQVVEKEVVGEYATTGTFYFKSLSLFLDAAEWCLVNNVQRNNTFFVSSALNYLINKGEKIEYSLINPKDYVSYSMPIDYSEGERNGKI